MDEVWAGGLRFEPEEIVALDDELVLAAVRTGGRARGTGIELDQLLSGHDRAGIPDPHSGW